jgi:hypothetical protein
MILRNIKDIVIQKLINVPGWCTNRKIVVFASDDWGSIRMPSKQTYNLFEQKGYGVEKSFYNRFDCLESEDDLEQLFDLLNSYRDINNNPAVFTANCNVANPDFDKIKASNFETYYYERVDETIKNYPMHNGILDLWKYGQEKKLFIPQFHGREHLQISRWMNRLREKDETIMFTFENRTTFSGEGARDYNFMGALNIDSLDEIPFINSVIDDGLKIFNELLGYRPKSFIAPCYAWHSAIEPVLKENGVKYIQSGIVQLEPPLVGNKYKKHYHYTGQKSRKELYYIIRNCYFEPTITPNIDSVSSCLSQIKNAFKWHKPAIISTHRINYIGQLDENNRSSNLVLLKKLLNEIQKRWPDVEFMAIDKLGDLIVNQHIENI